MSIQTLFDSNQAGMTVYMPDCIRSHLAGHLDHAIQERTGFVPVYRQWIQHDYNSVMRFYTAPVVDVPQSDNPAEAARKYDNIPPDKLQPGHLLPRLLLSGPALLTIWKGDNAIAKLLSLKGATHPAEAKTDTLRGNFWCDNPVCNLLHTSDHTEDALRELDAIQSTPILDSSPQPLPLLPTQAPVQPNSIAHSAMLTLSSVIERMLYTRVDAPAHPIHRKLPESGNAHATRRMMLDWFAGAVDYLKNRDNDITSLIEAFLSGDIVAVTRLCADMPVTQWELFVIQCGALSQEAWQTASSTAERA
jgi:nucleoside diphosphate kinase